MADQRMFYRLFLYAPEDSRFPYRIRVCPDLEQSHGSREPTAVISLLSLELLALCLRELGVTGYSCWPDQVDDTVSFLTVPTQEYHECPPDEIVASHASLGIRPLVKVADVTLIATNTSIGEMKTRIASLRAKALESLLIED